MVPARPRRLTEGSQAGPVSPDALRRVAGPVLTGWSLDRICVGRVRAVRGLRPPISLGSWQVEDFHQRGTIPTLGSRRARTVLPVTISQVGGCGRESHIGPSASDLTTGVLLPDLAEQPCFGCPPIALHSFLGNLQDHRRLFDA